MQKKKAKNNSFKKFIAKLHLWLGLGSGLIVFIVAVTGCIFVFHDEIKENKIDSVNLRILYCLLWIGVVHQCKGLKSI